MLLSNSDEWNDIKPIEQDEGSTPAVPIMYNEIYTDRMNYFRGIINVNEKSIRALKLVDEIITLNQSNYTAWHYRRLILKELNDNNLYKNELEYVTNKALESPKNYQIWHHRRAIVIILNDSTNELDFINQILQIDTKNYHAWAHRQWCIQYFNLFDNELEFCEYLINLDVRNNSVWNQRWFVSKNEMLYNTKTNILKIRLREINYALNKIHKDYNNESPFNYIRGFVKLIGFPKFFINDNLVNNNSINFKYFPFILNNLINILNDKPDEGFTPPLLGLLVDIYEDINNKNESIKYCNLLSNKYDTIRNKYWNYRIEQIKQQ